MLVNSVVVYILVVFIGFCWFLDVFALYLFAVVAFGLCLLF